MDHIQDDGRKGMMSFIGGLDPTIHLQEHNHHSE